MEVEPSVEHQLCQRREEKAAVSSSQLHVHMVVSQTSQTEHDSVIPVCHVQRQQVKEVEEDVNDVDPMDTFSYPSHFPLFHI